MEPRLFIGSSGEKLDLAYAVQENLDHDNVEVSVWTQGIFEPSGNTLDSLLNELDNSDYGLFIFAPDDITKIRGQDHPTVRDNVLFELGLYIGRLGRKRSFFLIPRGSNLSLPSDLLGVTPLWFEPNRSDRNLRAALGPACNELRRRITPTEASPQPPPEAIKKAAKSIIDAASHSRAMDHARDNKCFREIIVKSLQDVSGELGKLESESSRYRMPAAQYPRYLLHLKRKLKARVDAVAMVEQEEPFWKDETGNQIWRTAHKESRRVFVFTHGEQFDRYYDELQQHALNYKVFVTSREKLWAQVGIPYTKNFVIIEASDDTNVSRVLAEYEGAEPEKSISFVADEWEVSNYHDKFQQIIANAQKIDADSSSEKERNDIRELVFELQPPTLSDYISVVKYHQHQEEHPFYQDMMNRMIGILEEHCSAYGEPCRVLEMGAGTGLFTKRLAQVPDLKEIVAVELDQPYFAELRHSLKEHANVTCLNRFGRQGVTGKFHYIFSSFAEHHVGAAGKRQYLANIRRNLEPGGLFVIGDEFLRSYQVNDEADWKAALKAYEFIIQEAEDEGHSGVAELEREALKSGLERRVEFKVSREQYEESLADAGFDFAPPEKIGPHERDDVGGVFVYKAWSRS